LDSRRVQYNTTDTRVSIQLLGEFREYCMNKQYVPNSVRAGGCAVGVVDLDDEIGNWCRTVRAGRVIHRCGSAEKHFRAPLELIEREDDPLPPSVPVDVRRGWRVELAWRAIPAVRVRLLVSWHYIRNRSLREAARKAKVDPRRASFELSEAREALYRWLSRRVG
jgi:hypothetical protein